MTSVDPLQSDKLLVRKVLSDLFRGSLIVCLFVGIPLGTFVFGVITGTPSLVFQRDIAGVPVLVYAVILAAPIAFLAALASTVILFVLLRSKRWNPAWQGWLLACSGLGIVLASCLDIVISTTGFVDRSAWSSSTAIEILAPAGGVSGAILGLYARNTKRRLAELMARREATPLF